MAIVLMELLALAALQALAAIGLTRRPAGRGRARAVVLRHGPWILVLGVLVWRRRALAALDPMAAVPLILLALILERLWRALGRWRQRRRPDTRSLLVILSSLFALVGLARSALNVQSANSYLAFLLPAALVVFVYAWTWRWPAMLGSTTAVHWARRFALAALLAWVAVSAVSVTYRLRTRHVYAIATARGTLLARPDRGQGFSEAIRFVEQYTRPGEAVAVLPEGTSILFFADRRNPLKEELATPGLLDDERAIARLEATGTRLVLITNRPADEYGARAFGRDYSQRTMEWIASRFRPCGVFGPNPRPHREIGASQFFVKAYCRP
jgi:hypothetical protein